MGGKKDFNRVRKSIFMLHVNDHNLYETQYTFVYASLLPSNFVMLSSNTIDLQYYWQMNNNFRGYSILISFCGAYWFLSNLAVPDEPLQLRLPVYLHAR